MRRIYQIISWVSLTATILPAILFLAGTLDLNQTKMMMVLATLGWFVHTPLWMGRAVPMDTGQEETT
jgi:ABC-type uncharacterized transport system permease subunit